MCCCYIIFSDTSSSGTEYIKINSSKDHGTLFQLRNLINWKNVVTEPSKEMNACEEFLVVALSAHVLSSALEILQMDSLDDVPSSTSIFPPKMETWKDSKAAKKADLYGLCEAIVKRFNNIAYLGSNNTVYSSKIFSLGLLYVEYNDAIKEGDGARLLRCWRYLLPLFKVTQHKNYSNEILNALYSYHFLLSERPKSQLLYSCFINTRGIASHNIAADLHIEHMNRVVKEAIKGLGSNKTPAAIQRIGKSLGPLINALDTFDEDNKVKAESHHHSKPPCYQDIQILVKELTEKAVFRVVHNRKPHDSFKKMKHPLLATVKERDLRKWMIKHIKVFNMSPLLV